MLATGLFLDQKTQETGDWITHAPGRTFHRCLLRTQGTCDSKFQPLALGGEHVKRDGLLQVEGIIVQVQELVHP